MREFIEQWATSGLVLVSKTPTLTTHYYSVYDIIVRIPVELARWWKVIFTSFYSTPDTTGTDENERVRSFLSEESKMDFRIP